MSAELYCMLNKSVDHLKKNLQDFTLMFSEPSVTSGFTVCVHSLVFTGAFEEYLWSFLADDLGAVHQSCYNAQQSH